MIGQNARPAHLSLDHHLARQDYPRGITEHTGQVAAAAEALAVGIKVVADRVGKHLEYGLGGQARYRMD